MPVGRVPTLSTSPVLALVNTIVADSIFVSSSSLIPTSVSAIATADPPSVWLVR